MAKTLTFNRGIGAFKVGETYDIENETTAQYFINNSFATEEIADEGCADCKSVEVNVTEEKPKNNKKSTK
jgi:hypothetical protein